MVSFYLKTLLKDTKTNSKYRDVAPLSNDLLMSTLRFPFHCCQVVVVVLFFSANSLYCSSIVENDKKIIA